MGKALASQGSIDEAVGHLSTAARLKPDFVEAHVNLGTVFLARAQFDEAAFHFGAAARIEPDVALVQYGWGTALAGQGKTAEAIGHLSRSVELQPDYVEALNGLAWALATDGSSKIRDGARAVALAERACELAGDTHPLLLDTLAAAYAESGDFDGAAATARKAMALARSAGRTDWAQDIEKRLGLYEQEIAFRSGSP
jgi:Flp pilus assembly protein TadD